jgi:hypothetical protein
LSWLEMVNVCSFSFFAKLRQYSQDVSRERKYPSLDISETCAFSLIILLAVEYFMPL